MQSGQGGRIVDPQTQMSASEQFSDGEAYERLMGRWSRAVGSGFLDWCAVAPRLAWLDVGCGNGAFTEEIVRRAAPSMVAGVDPAPAQLAFARQRPGAAGAKFVTGDAQALPFEDNSFDAAMMALVIAFVPDPAKAMLEMRRVTRPGGTIAAYMWDLPGGGLPLAPVYRALAEIGHGAPMPPSAAISEREALAGLWRGAGLADIETAVFRIEVRFDSFEDFWQSSTLPVGPQAERIRSLSPEARDALRARLRAGLPSAADGSVSYDAVANGVRGRVPHQS